MALILKRCGPAHRTFNAIPAFKTECRATFPGAIRVSTDGSVNYWLLVCAILLLIVIFGAPIVYRLLDSGKWSSSISSHFPAQEDVSHEGPRITEKIAQSPQLPATPVEKGLTGKVADNTLSMFSLSEIPEEGLPFEGDTHKSEAYMPPVLPKPSREQGADESLGRKQTPLVNPAVKWPPETSAPKTILNEESLSPPVAAAGDRSVPVEGDEKPAARSSEAEAEQKSDQTWYVIVEQGNVRAGPSLDAAIKFRIRRGDAVTVTEQQKNWYAVAVDDGRIGWAHHSLFSHTPPAPTQSDPGQKETLVKKIHAIRPVITADNRTGVIFELNGYYPPETKVLDGGHPRLVCDFPDTLLSGDIPRRRELKSGHIERIRIGIHGQSRSKVRVVMDFRPGQDYTIEQLFYKKENYYTLMVRAREGPAETPPAKEGISEGPENHKTGANP